MNFLAGCNNVCSGVRYWLYEQTYIQREFYEWLEKNTWEKPCNSEVGRLRFHPNIWMASKGKGEEEANEFRSKFIAYKLSGFVMQIDTGTLEAWWVYKSLTKQYSLPFTLFLFSKVTINQFCLVSVVCYAWKNYDFTF